MIDLRKPLRAAIALIWLITSALAQTPSVPLGPSGSPSTGTGGSGTVTGVNIIAGTNLTETGTCNSSTAVACTLNASGGGTPGGTTGQVQFNSAGSFGGFTVSGDCTLVTSTGVITCPSISGKAVSLSGPLTTTGPSATTTLAFGATGDTYTFPDVSDTVVTLAATQTLTNKSIAGAEINSGTVALARMPTVLGAVGYVSGNWYSNPYVTGATLASNGGVTNSYYCAPFWITQSVTIKALAINVVTTSTANSNSALQGAIYADLLTTTPAHRPGTFIDYAGSGVVGFTTSAAAPVSAAMANTTDALTGPAMYWTCVQKFDATATYTGIGFGGNGSQVGAVLGSATLSKVLAASASGTISGVSTTGTTYGSAGWVNFTSATTWADQSSGVGSGPVMTIQAN